MSVRKKSITIGSARFHRHVCQVVKERKSQHFVALKERHVITCKFLKKLVFSLEIGIFMRAKGTKSPERMSQVIYDVFLESVMREAALTGFDLALEGLFKRLIILNHI
jgi:hypothetical protein